MCKRYATSQGYAKGYVKIRHNLVLSIYLATTKKGSLCRRKKIWKPVFLKTEKRAAYKFPFMGALDIAGFQEAAPRGMLCDEESDVSTLMLMKTNGAYTESIDISPESTKSTTLTTQS